MKFLPLLLAVFLTAGTARAQIFINTGHVNGDKYKQDSTNNYSNTSKATSDTNKVDVPVKTPSVNVKPQAATPTPRALKPAPAAVPAKPMPQKISTAVPAPAAPATAVDLNNLPPNAEVGKCYARCYAADKYETKVETVVDKPLSYKTQAIPATYKTVYDTLITKPASVYSRQIPAVYETVTEDVLVSPATQKWVKGAATAGCLSANPADCQVLCLQQVAAVYKKVSRKVVKTPAYQQDIPVAAETKIVPRRVIDQPSRQNQIEVPATYKKVTHKELVSKGGYSEWKEILCGDKLTASKIISIQKALKANGYDPGAFDDVFGPQTKAALVKYQQDKNLPVGNLNMETLKALEVE